MGGDLIMSKLTALYSETSDYASISYNGVKLVEVATVEGQIEVSFNDRLFYIPGIEIPDNRPTVIIIGMPICDTKPKN